MLDGGESKSPCVKKQMRSSTAGAVGALSHYHPPVTSAFVAVSCDRAGEYRSAIRVRWLCGLLSNYFDYLFYYSLHCMQSGGESNAYVHVLELLLPVVSHEKHE